MRRSAGTRELKRFEEGADLSDIEVIYQLIFKWKKDGLSLNTDPEMPAELRNRQADNWRVLISIADLFGAHWAKAARDAAVALSKNNLGEDVRVTLLHDIREVFNTRGVDRLTSKELVAGLNDLEESAWSEWRGIRDNDRPHHLSQSELAGLLAPFGIRPRVIWPGHRAAGSKSARGYLRSQFEDAWASYCQGVTPSQPSNIRHLRRHGTRT